MRTFTQLKSDYLALTQNNSSENQTQGVIYINDSIRTISNIRGGKWRWLEATKNVATVASQVSYQVPNGFRKIMDVYITVGTTVYMPEMIFDPAKWKLVLSMKLGTSDVPRFTYINGNVMSIAPTPATNGNIITFRGRKNLKDLSIADYTTGTITSLTNGGTAIVGNGTTWISDMVGRFIKINSPTGDAQWYEIGSWTSSTAIGLLKPYEGISIVAGAGTYIIGQTSDIPEAYDIAPLYRSVATYWQMHGDTGRAKPYWLLYDGGVEAGYTQNYGGIIGQMIENEGETEEGAYIPPFAQTSNLPYAPYYQPYDQATGF